MSIFLKTDRRLQKKLHSTLNYYEDNPQGLTYLQGSEQEHNFPYLSENRHVS